MGNKDGKTHIRMKNPYETMYVVFILLWFCDQWLPKSAYLSENLKWLIKIHILDKMAWLMFVSLCLLKSNNLWCFSKSVNVRI